MVPYALGIIVTLGVYGVLQEQIMTQEFGGKLFSNSAFLVLCNRLVASALGLAVILRDGEAWDTSVPMWKYLVVSMSNVFSSTCQYEALKWVSFPVITVGKTIKMMPVMCWGMVLLGRRYSWKEWTIALVVSSGITEFVLAGPISSPASTQNSSFFGLLLLVGYIFFDGLTSTMQESLFQDYSVTRQNQMFIVNTYSAAISLGGLLISQRLGESMLFCVQEPAFFGCVILLSLAAAGSQWFMYSMVQYCGALNLAATLNVRQVFSTLVSYIHYGHSITTLQIASLSVVFTALFAHSLKELCPKSEPDEKSSGLTEADPLLPFRAGPDEWASTLTTREPAV